MNATKGEGGLAELMPPQPVASMRELMALEASVSLSLVRLRLLVTEKRFHKTRLSYGSCQQVISDTIAHHFSPPPHQRPPLFFSKGRYFALGFMHDLQK